MKDFFLGLLKFLVILTILGVVGLFLMYKCTKSVSEGVNEMHNPKNYAVSIKDFVRYTLAEAHPEFANYGYYDSELKIKTNSKIRQLADKEDDPEKASYKIALETLSKNGTDFEKRYAGNLLKTYNALKIDLTPYKVDEEYDFKWHFTEKNSRVRFTVSLGLLSYYDADSWDLDRYTEYLETGVFEAAPDISSSTEIENNNNREIIEEYDEELSEQAFHEPIESKPYETTSNDEVFAYLRYVIGEQFAQKDIQYLEAKYSPLIPAELHIAHAEYVDHEDKLFVSPTETVIIDIISYHYGVPNYVGEFFVNAEFHDGYYRGRSPRASRICYAYELCEKLLEDGRFDAFYKDIQKEEYAYPMDVNKLKYVKSPQERKICEALSIFNRIDSGNGGIDGFRIFADYFDYIDYDPYTGGCSFYGEKKYTLYSSK